MTTTSPVPGYVGPVPSPRVIESPPMSSEPAPQGAANDGAAGGHGAPKRPRKRLSAGKRVLFALLPVLVLVGGSEAFFRIREVTRYARRQVHGAPRVPDAWRTFVLEPGARFEESGRVATINSYGMRSPEGRDPAVPKPEGVQRVICVGGSTTYGMFVTRDHLTWPARCEETLHARGHATVEVWNAGVPAWDARTSMTNLELRLFDLAPDVVIVCHVYNDVVANHDPSYPRLAALEWGDRWSMWTPLHEHSALYRFVLSRFKSPKDALKVKAESLSDVGVEAFRTNLRRLVRRIRERGAKVLLATEPSCYRPTYEESVRDGVPGVVEWYGDLSPLAYPALIEGIARYNEVVREVARETGAALCDLDRRMPKDVKLFASPVHHTDEGEVHVSGFVADALLEAGLVH